MLLALLPAFAFDAHGLPSVPAAEETSMTWTATEEGGPALGLQLEYAEKPLLFMTESGVETLVDDLVVVDLSARWQPHHRLGVAVDLPLYLMGPTDQLDGGPSLADLRLWAPLTLWTPGDFSLALVPGLTLPTGDEQRFLGEAALQGSALLAATWDNDAWTLAANVGVARTRRPPMATSLDQAFGSRVLLGAAVSYRASDRLALSAELGSQIGTSSEIVRAAPVELRIGAGWAWTDSLTLRGGVGWALTSGAGAPQARAFVGLTWQLGVEADPVVVPQVQTSRIQLLDPEGQPVAGATLRSEGTEAVTDAQGWASLGLAPGVHEVSITGEGYQARETSVLLVEGEGTVELVLERPPGALSVSAQDPQGQPLDARVWFDGPQTVPETALGADGSEDLALTDGLWTVWVEAEGFGAQARRVQVDTGRKVLAVAEFVLLPDEGEAELTLLVVDPDGLPVEVDLSLDGRPLGRSSSGGGLVLQGLKPGPHRVEGAGEHFREGSSTSFTLLVGGQEEVLVMLWQPGTVRVITRDLHGQALDAMVAFSGEQLISPEPVGPDGERFYSLTPGSWTVMVSSSSFGIQQREVQVVSNETSLIAINAVMRESAGSSALALWVVDEEGQPIRRATVALDGEPLGTTSNGGSVWVGGLAEGVVRVEAAGEVYEYVVEEVPIEGDIREFTLTLPYRSGSVEVRALSAEGAPTDALIRAAGPFTLPPLSLGEDGRRMVFLEPGEWVVAASSPLLGVVEKDLSMVAGQEARLDLTFIAASEGAAELVDLAAEAITLLAPVEFESDSAELLASSEGILAALAEILLETPSISRVEVQGHTDSKGGTEDNLALSQARAETVVGWLVEAGVEAERLEAHGYGESVGVATNDTPEGRARNRRVEVHILERTEP